VSRGGDVNTAIMFEDGGGGGRNNTLLQESKKGDRNLGFVERRAD
jgi:hypothetical protein